MNLIKRIKKFLLELLLSFWFSLDWDSSGIGMVKGRLNKAYLLILNTYLAHPMCLRLVTVSN